jgi:hypothetical protein
MLHGFANVEESVPDSYGQRQMTPSPRGRFCNCAARARILIAPRQAFRLGSQVAWTLGNADTEWIGTMLGVQLQRPVDAAEEHHGGVPEDTVPTKGKVVSIAAIHCRYAPQPDSGSGTL